MTKITVVEPGSTLASASSLLAEVRREDVDRPGQARGMKAA